MGWLPTSVFAARATVKCSPRCAIIFSNSHNHLAARRFQQHVGTALQNRLLPEIALQHQDWLYEHDVIKGFR